MKKNILVVLWGVITVVVIVSIMSFFNYFETYFPPSSFILAFVFHFFLMGWYAFSLPYINLDYNSNYYNTSPIEKEGMIYVYLGVTIFRWFLKTIGWNKISDKSHGIILKSLDRLKKREKHTREAEFAHLLLFIHFIIIIFFKNNNVLWLFLLNIILHVYPVFVQHYNRPRYLKLMSKL